MSGVYKEIYEKLSSRVKSQSDTEENKIIQELNLDKNYINVSLTTSFLGDIIYRIINDNNDSFINPLSLNNINVMVEFSQPNTHKAFHVGHMRNVALGNSMCRLFKYKGYNVISANYYGDEGTHVASCVWYLDSILKTKKLNTLENARN